MKSRWFLAAVLVVVFWMLGIARQLLVKREGGISGAARKLIKTVDDQFDQQRQLFAGFMQALEKIEEILDNKEFHDQKVYLGKIQRVMNDLFDEWLELKRTLLAGGLEFSDLVRLVAFMHRHDKQIRENLGYYKSLAERFEEFACTV